MAEHKYKLTYFNIKGITEHIRFLFAFANVDFEDNRVCFADWPKMKETIPFGKLPILEVDGKILNQSVCINRFVGKQVGLVAEDSFTEALLEALVDNLRDMYRQSKSILEKDPNALDEHKKIIGTAWTLCENALDDGYFYSSKPTWVDIYVTGFIDFLEDKDQDCLKSFPKLKAHVDKIRSNDGIQRYIKNRPVPEKFPEASNKN